MKYNFSAQGAIHSLEQGKLAPYVRLAAFITMVLALSVVYNFVQFCGLRHADAMDQAQISRSLAAGEGFSTKYIRPLALWQLEKGGKELPKGNFPDFTQQPLLPLINAIPLWLAKSSWTMSPLDIVYTGDRIIALSATIFFLLSVILWYHLAKRLFDIKLAGISTAAILMTDLFWQFSISGLPQMLLLFLFASALWFSLNAVGEGYPSPPNLWKNLPLSAVFFGLMTLTHGLSFWIFLGWLIFFGIFARYSLKPVLLSLAIYALVVSPWLVRNYMVCGNPFGLNVFTALFTGQEPAMTLMRQLDPDFRGVASGLREKIKDGILSQLGFLFSFLGLNVLAAAFFVSLLHRFKSPTAGVFRWCLLLMWIVATFGMALYGLRRDPLSSNQLHVLFIPAFIFFGIAFLFVLWNRLSFDSFFLNKLFPTIMLCAVAIPMISTIFLTKPSRIQWPPYIPPFISVLGNWFSNDEILCADIPWACAWYADRKTILLPDSPRTLTRISDYRVLGSPVKGLYLTPETGNQPMMSEIYKGAYRDWVGLITRPPNAQGFFLRYSVPLPINGECIIFADSERWMKR